MLQRRQRRSTGAAIETGDGDMVGARLGDTGGNRADTHFRYQLHRNISFRIDVLQIVDQLRQIFDRIDVMVRRRRDEADTRCGVTGLGDRRIHLVAGQLSALAGLRTLRHLDLQHVGIDQIFGRDAKTAGCDLLDGRAFRVRLAVQQRHVTVGFFAAFAGVGLAADAVHGDGKRRMRLAADGAEGHGAGREALDDVSRRFDVVDGDRLAAESFRRLDLEQTSDGVHAQRRLIHHAGEFAVAILAVAAHGMLQRGNGIRRPGVAFAAHAIGIFAANIERVGKDRILAEGSRVAGYGFFGDFSQTDALDGGGGAEEIFLDEFRRQADGVEDLRAAIGLVGGNAHLGHDLEDALTNCLDVTINDFVVGHFLRECTVLVHVEKRIEGEIGVDRLRAITGEQTEMVDFARFTGFHDETDRGAQTLADQVMVHGGRRQKCRDRDAVRAELTVGENDDVVAAANGGFRPLAQAVEHFRHAFRTALHIIGEVERLGVETVFRVADGADLFQIAIGQDRLAHFQTLGTGRALVIEKVRAWANERNEAHHQFFADRIDRRVGDLREVLLEIGVEQLRLVRHGRNRRIGAHRADSFLTRRRHRRHQELRIFAGVTEGLLTVEQ
ncbi:hypothetical protein D3C71_977650 [compost metagenome]